ncbi:MAG: hypothetical protein EA420_02875 [Candidatus Competibacteraceae bacterium]|nr:MAG: hypothetical protein EA420_02875 [Candidatus Competibacteraceae bacterium]
MIDQLCARLPQTGCDIAELAGILLRFCRDHAEAVRAAHDSAAAAALLHREEHAASVWFRNEVDDDRLDPLELAAIATRLRRISATAEIDLDATVAAVVAARAVATGLDDALGYRFAGLFRRRGKTRLREGDPCPVVRPDWPVLLKGNLGTHPARRGYPLSELLWLRLTPPLHRGHQIDLECTWSDPLARFDRHSRIGVAIPWAGLEALDFTLDPASPQPSFSVRLRDSDQRWPVIEGLLRQAAEQGIDVLVLPELSVDADWVDRAEQWLQAHPQSPSVVVLGSFHDQRQGRRRNICTTLAPGSRLHEHYKFNAFEWRPPDPATGAETVYREDIATTPATITIHLGRHWSLTTLICKDFIEPGVDHLLEELRVGLVLIPACSETTEPFLHNASRLASNAQAVVVVANLTAINPQNPASALVARPARFRVCRQHPRADLQPPVLVPLAPFDD